MCIRDSRYVMYVAENFGDAMPFLAEGDRVELAAYAGQLAGAGPDQLVYGQMCIRDSPGYVVWRPGAGRSAHSILALAPALLQNCDVQVRPRRGLDHAGGHLPQPVHPGPRRLAHGAGAAARDVVEDAAEGAQAFPAGRVGDLGDGQARVAQQRDGLLDAPRQQVTVRRQAERCV